MTPFIVDPAPAVTPKHRDISSSTAVTRTWERQLSDLSSTVPKDSGWESLTTDVSSTVAKDDDQDAPKRKWAYLKAAFGMAAVLAIPTAETRKRWDEARDSYLSVFAGAEVQTSTTAPNDAVAELRSSVVQVFRRARLEFFEEGTDSVLATELWDILGRFAALSPVDVIAWQVLTCGLPPSVGAEAIRALGRVHDPLSLEARRWFAEQAIRYSAHPALRYGAALALATFDDPEARNILEEATEHEALVALRRNMEQMLRQLQTE